MVVGYLLSGVINRIPIVNKLNVSPSTEGHVSSEILEVEESSVQEPYTPLQSHSDRISITDSISTSASASGSGSGSSGLDEYSSEYEDHGEVKPIHIKKKYQSPKDKLHSKILQNRTQSAAPFESLASAQGSTDFEIEGMGLKTHAASNISTSVNASARGSASTMSNSSPHKLTPEELDSRVVLGSPVKKKTYNSIDNSSIKSVTSRLSRRSKKRNEDVKLNNTFVTAATPVEEVEEEDKDTEKIDSNGSISIHSAMEETKDARVDQYLSDQNDKFNKLISNNIDVVLNPQQVQAQKTQASFVELAKSPTPNQVLLKMAYENKGAIASSIFKYGAALVKSRLPHIPFFNDKTTQMEVAGEEGEEDEDVEENGLAMGYLNAESETDFDSDTAPQTAKELLGSPLGSPRATHGNQMVGYNTCTKKLSLQLRQNRIDQRDFDKLVSNLDDEVKIDIFLDSLDENTKMNLYQLLQKDLDLFDAHSSSSVKNVYYDHNISTVDKVQIFVIISVKLFMTGVKLFIPITKYLLHKFQNNELFIFNLKNLNRLIDSVLKFMSYLDVKLNSNEDFIEKVAQHDYIKAEQDFEDLYQDFTNRTRDYLKPSAIKDRFLAKDDHLKRGVYDYLIGNASESLSLREKNYQDDPQYAMYYSGSSSGYNNNNNNSGGGPGGPGAGSGNDPNVAASQSGVFLEKRSRANNTGGSKKPSDVSFMDVADRFIEQLDAGV